MAARLTSGRAVVVRWPILESTVDLDEPESAELARRIGSAWVQIRRGASMGRLREHLYGAGDEPIELGQMDALDLLARQARWRMSDLAEALRIDPSTATRAVQRLVSSGFAKRCPHDDDGRGEAPDRPTAAIDPATAAIVTPIATSAARTTSRFFTRSSSSASLNRAFSAVGGSIPTAARRSQLAVRDGRTRTSPRMIRFRCEITCA